MAIHSQRLNANTVYSSLFNFVRLVGVLGAKLKIDDSNAQRYKLDGYGRYEDQLEWISCDVLTSKVFDPTDTNVLATEQKVTPAYKIITVDQVRQIGLTLPTDFLASQAFQNANYFDEIVSLAQSMIQKTRKLYDQRLVDTYIGTTVSTQGKQSQSVTLTGSSAQDDTLAIAEKVSNILFDMADTTRDYNDRAYMSAFGKEDVEILWNSKYFSKMMKVGLPVTYNKDGVLENGRTLHARYFGTPITTSNYSTYSASTPAAGKPIDSDDGTYVPGSNNANGTLRALAEQDITVSGTTTHVFPGDELPAGAVVYASSEVKIPCYIEDAKVICKIISKDAIKYVSSIETETSFVNGKNHSQNFWLTFMYANPDRLPEETFTTLKQA